MASAGYFRFPHINSDSVVFVAGGDVWLAPPSGGRAWRFTTDGAAASGPRFSTDGSHLAWTSERDGSPEVYVGSLADGTAGRLTYWGASMARVCGWTDGGEVLAVSPAGQPFRGHMRPRVLSTALSGGPGADRILPFGPASDIAAGPGRAALLTGTWGQDLAHWKRYRGGTAGRLWLGDGIDGPADSFRRMVPDISGQLGSPMIVGDRLAFLSDYEGTGNVYSVAADGTGLRRHTDHDGWYARHASTDGRRVIYACGGELWLLDGLDADPVRLDIVLGAPLSGRTPRLITAADHVGALSVDKSGRASAVEVRGTVHWLTHQDGPARALAVVPGARARFPQVLGTGGDVVWATDEDGTDALVVGGAGPAVPAPRRLAAGQIGRVQSLAAAPDGTAVAVAAQDGHVRVVDVASGGVRELAASGNGYGTGLAWSPDSAWLAWSEPTEHPVGSADLGLRKLRLARVADGEVTDVTDGRFIDTDPVFTMDGKYLAFLSKRSFDPIYDAHFFDLSFPYGARPYLLPLRVASPSPFDPQLAGRPAGEDDKAGSGGGDKPGGGAAGGTGTSGTGWADETAAGADEAGSGAVVIDAAGMAGRVVPLPVPESRYSRLRAVKGGLAWLREPVAGQLGLGGAAPDDNAPRPSLERFDFGKRTVTELAGDADWFEASGDGSRLVISDHGKLTVVPADRKADPDNEDDQIVIDRSRARFTADPAAMWEQAYAEAFRIMRHDFWVADMADVDWDGVREEYRPLLDRIGCASDFTDLLWEVFGELGCSHAYARVADPGKDGDGVPGMLGADLERDGDAWRVSRIVLGDTSDPRARTPLAAPGVDISVGDALLAVDGQPIGPQGPGPLLLATAGKPVGLTVGPADGDEPRQVAVVPLRSDTRLRYLDWVRQKRQLVRQLSDGRAGYLHVPDMVSNGWADFLRDLRTEMMKDAIIVDVRSNSGGHTSELVIERLNRRLIGWGLIGGMRPGPYPDNAPRGPIVAVADEFAGSDGDIVNMAIQALGLGPVVGTRTWGGVLGYDVEHELVDGTQMTVPRLSVWFETTGWSVENYGVDPDVEVLTSPADWAAGHDTQLETAVRLAMAALAERPAAQPPDPATRPSRRRPPLPPRAG